MVTINGVFEIDELERQLAGRILQLDDEVDLSHNILPHLRNIFPLHFRFLTILKLNDCGILTVARTTFKLLGNLEYLNLNNNLIEDLPNDLLDQCLRLKHLTLRKNRLRTFRTAVYQQLPNLTNLDLAFNLIRSVTSTTFRRLEKLNLSNNLIHKFHGNTYDRVQSLNLSYNELNKLVSSLTRNIPYLRDFDCSHNDIDTIAPMTFKYTPCLRTLRFNSNRLVRFSTDLLSDTCRLDCLELNNNRIECLNVKAVHSPHLQTLAFGSSLNVDFKMFDQFVNLKRLDLSRCSFRAREMPPINRFRQLEYFNFTQNYFLIVPNKYFHGLDNLKLLLLDNSSWVSLASLSDSLMSRDNTLVRLSMSNCNICEISNFFRYLFLLTHLNLSHNKLVRVAADSFKDLIALEELLLDANELEYMQVNAFRFLLRLRVCDLRENRFKRLNRRLFETTVNLKRLLIDRDVRMIDEPLVLES